MSATGPNRRARRRSVSALAAAGGGASWPCAAESSWTAGWLGRRPCGGGRRRRAWPPGPCLAWCRRVRGMPPWCCVAPPSPSAASGIIGTGSCIPATNWDWRPARRLSRLPGSPRPHVPAADGGSARRSPADDARRRPQRAAGADRADPRRRRVAGRFGRRRPGGGRARAGRPGRRPAARLRPVQPPGDAPQSGRLRLRRTVPGGAAAAAAAAPSFPTW